MFSKYYKLNFKIDQKTKPIVISSSFSLGQQPSLPSHLSRSSHGSSTLSPFLPPTTFSLSISLPIYSSWCAIHYSSSLPSLQLHLSYFPSVCHSLSVVGSTAPSARSHRCPSLCSHRCSVLIGWTAVSLSALTLAGIFFISGNFE